VKELLKKALPLFSLIPLIIGTIGYRILGDTFSNCLYAGFALYFTNPISDAYNGFIEFARWTAPLVTVSAILCILKNVWNNIIWRFKGFSKDSVVVYSDDIIKIQFNASREAVYAGEKFKRYFKSHIILFSSDDKSLKFFEENRKALKNKSVYIGLRDLEQGLLKNFENVIIFDVNRTISRVLWKNIGLWKQKKEHINIVIYGNGALSRQILSTGLQLNLFSKNQRIKYHFITDNSSFELRHKGLNLMNGDKVVYHTAESDKAWKVIRLADIVIVTDKFDCDLFQNIIINAQGKVYYYSPNRGDMGDCLDFGSIFPFGRDEEIFTDDNIRNEKLIDKAKKLNENYAKVNPEKGMTWEKLSGFLKESNISLADYTEVLSELLGSAKETELAELEHIRWCRFYYLNYWKYSEQRNNKKRLHNDLKPFGELSEIEKAKDFATVEMAKKKI